MDPMRATPEGHRAMAEVYLRLSVAGVERDETGSGGCNLHALDAAIEQRGWMWDTGPADQGMPGPFWATVIVGHDRSGHQETAFGWSEDIALAVALDRAIANERG